jgi:type I restriction enzyme M protein
MRGVSRDTVVFLNPTTCGLYKDGGTRYKIDPATGKRSNVVDNEMIEHVTAFLGGDTPPGMARMPVAEAYNRRVLVPRYYDGRWREEFEAMLRTRRLRSISLGKLEEEGIISVRGGHGSPGNDVRRGTVPYIKVSDIRALRININPTNLVPLAVARRFWGGETSGLQAWDLVTPNRASSNIGEFAMLLPGEEKIVLTKEVFVIRVRDAQGWCDPFYLLWAFSLKAVRLQWNRVALMQTNREDVGTRYREIEIPSPPSPEWAREVSAPFREYFLTLATARERFVGTLRASGYEFVASTYTTGSAAVGTGDST